MGFLSSFVAPLTLITTLLFYFGYVSTREYFHAFGIDVDILGFSSQDYVMRSPGALLVPVTILLLLAAALVVGHRMLRRRLLDASPPARRTVVSGLAATGGLLAVGGVVLAFLVPVLGGWPAYPLVTPLAIAAGAGLGAYAASTARVLNGGGDGRSVVVILVLVMVAGTFWATATLAQWWGRGQAHALASDLSVLPSIVLDTGERLYPGNDAVTFQRLDDAATAPVADGAATPAASRYHFRYTGLRLLVDAGGRLYLVPDDWSPDASTLVVPDDDAIRVRYRFVPDDTTDARE
jgi:hypothetical protein